MSVAVERIRELLEAIATSQGATASEVASRLGLGRQAVVRILDTMVVEGLANKDETSKKYRPGLLLYQWGAEAVQPYRPLSAIRDELARLAAGIAPHPVFYCIRFGTTIIHIERTVKLGQNVLTIPEAIKRDWATSTMGHAIVAFEEPGAVADLISQAKLQPAALEHLQRELETVRRQGFSENRLAANRYAVSAPILGPDGFAFAGVSIGINNFVEEDGERIVQELLDTAGRASFHAGYSASMFVP